MRVYRYFTFFFAIIICSAGQVHGRTADDKTDSIKHAIQTAKADTARVNLLLALSGSISCNDTTQKIGFANEALRIARNIQWSKGIISSYISIGRIYNDCINDYKNAISFFQGAVSSADNNNDTINRAIALEHIATAYLSWGKYKDALDYSKQTLQLRPKPDIVMGALGNMGNIYEKTGDYTKALACYDSSLKVLDASIRTSRKSDVFDTLQMAALEMSKGDIHIAMSQYDMALENYNNALTLILLTPRKNLVYYAYIGIGKIYRYKKEPAKAIEYYTKALEECKRINYTTYEANIFSQLGTVYLESGAADKAMTYTKIALGLATQSADTATLPDIYTSLGKIYTKQKNYSAAVPYLQKAIGMSAKSGALDGEKDAWEALSNTYEAMKNPALALDAYKHFITLRDSIYSQEKAKEITRTEMQGEIDRKQITDSLRQAAKDAQKDAVVQLHNNRQRVVIYGSFAGILAVLLLTFFIYRNYTFQKKANARIKIEKENAEVQRQRAERSEQFKQQFLANMSHEIRTPMNAVSGMTNLLLDNPRADQKNYLEAISKSSDILLHIINDILDLSKIEAGKLDLEQIDFSLSDALKLVKETLGLKAGEKGLQLTTTIAADVPDVLSGDPYRLNQVLINLGGNAIKFTERGSVMIVVSSISNEAGGITLSFAITDTGIGIPADKVGQLFENFNQVNNSDTRKYGGTGLGLSISKQLIELQGGAITVASEVGKGTTFSFTLLCHEGSAARLQERIRAEQKIDGTVLDGLRILIADDNEYNVLVARDTLRLKSNVIIDEAGNGMEAIEMLQQHDYDVILMDVQMPVINGLDATRHIRTVLPYPKNNTPVIAFTASMLSADIDKCTEAGANTYIPKPFKAWQLIAAIAEVTGRKIAMQPTPSETQQGTIIKDNDNLTDLTYLREFCEGDEANMKRYIGMYLKGIPAFKAKMEQAIADKNMQQIALLIHGHKPKWIMMGMTTTDTLATQTEHQCHENNEVVYEQAQLLIKQTELSAGELETFAA